MINGEAVVYAKAGGKQAYCAVKLKQGSEGPGLYLMEMEDEKLVNKGAVDSYTGNEDVNNHSLNTALSWINSYGESGKHYLILLGESYGTTDSYSIGKSGVTITLKGTQSGNMENNITITKTSTGSLLSVTGEVILEDITLKGNDNNTAALVSVSGKLTMKTGSRITGNTNNNSAYTSPGGGVNIATTGNFTMEDGVIDNNHITGGTSPDTYYGGYGGGVHNSGVFTMNGGSIENNSAGRATYPGYGGGVYNKGTFTMTGGAIKNNFCVKLNDGVADEMYNNTHGGGVYGDGTFTMSGEAEISSNNAEIGGGVFVAKTFIMNGGSIAGNRASIAGAAVAVSNNNGISFSKTSGVIYGIDADTNSNKAADGIDATIHPIEIYDIWGDPPTSFYYNDTADSGVSLNSQSTGTNWIANQ
jgi:hypothetical protein